MLSLIIVCFMAFQSHKKVKYSVDYYLFFYYHIQYVGFCMSGFSSPTLCIPNIKWTRVWVMILSLESIFRQIRFYCCTTFRSQTNIEWNDMLKDILMNSKYISNSPFILMALVKPPSFCYVCKSYYIPVMSMQARQSPVTTTSATSLLRLFR